ncbi:MAG TPA: HAD-IIIA family hydrolase, partial [Thermoanaerobaculia bacterium]|nr:HAD-IIIA family hydrolase [Thermoanaerobaculia bacterium]
EWEAPRTLRDLHVRREAFAPLRQVQRAGWLVFLITNQPSFAKGKCSLEDLRQVHARILDELARNGVRITQSYVCFHHPESTIEGYGACECRKPKPFFIWEAAKTYGVELRESWMAGDQDTDVVTGINAGCRTALLKYEHSSSKRGSAQPDITCSDLAELVQIIVHG